MLIINDKLDFTLIKFPIFFPFIYYGLISYFPNYEIYVIFFTILLLAEPHFGATWPHFFSTFENHYISENKIRLIYAPIFIIFFCIVGFFLFKKLFFLIFFASNMYHVTRQSVGISKLYKTSIEQINFEENIIYIFNILFFIIGYLRFFYPVIDADQVLNLNIIILILISIFLLYSILKFGYSSNSFTLLSGIFIFYPICFVDNPIHAILMGVTMHYSQYLAITFNIGLKKNVENDNAKLKKNYLRNFILIIILYSILMTLFSYFGRSNFEIMKTLILIPIIGQMLHFFIDSQIWKFSDGYIKKRVLKYLVKS